MRIECPDCAAAYEVPEDRVSGARTVRCSRCGTQWVIRHEPPPAAVGSRIPEWTAPVAETVDRHDSTPDVPESRFDLQSPAPVSVLPYRDPEPAPIPAMQRLAQPVSAPPRRSGALVGWVISLVVIVLLCWGAFAWRAEIMQAWPPSTRAYAALGLAGTAK
ncbi:MAG: zinc-ribbon domain-containing protein [Acetobacteraceae bacterium]